MKIFLLPRVAPIDRIRIWVGILASQPPALTWLMDGVALSSARVVPLRPLASAIPAELLGGRSADNFTGVFEITGLDPGRVYNVTVHGLAGDVTASAELRVKTLPAGIPSILDGAFNILLGSCFYHAEDKGGQAGRLAAQLNSAARPDLALLLGDQVYLDLPTLANFPGSSVELARRFESDYRANWQGEVGYSRLLTLAPTISVPDDHEYWNNFPHSSPFIQNSWTQTGRDNWTAAAAALYQAFQFSYEPDAYLHGGPAEPGDASVINIEPLSLFIADGRSKRDPERATVLTTRARDQLEHWVSDTIQQRRIALFITGQSLLDSPSGELKGAIKDYVMPNYGDFHHITSQLVRVAESGLPVILITGDVHWGRLAAVRDARTGRESIFEVISSPISLVSSIGKDQLATLGEAIKDRTNIWPRHSQARPVPEFLWFSSLGARFTCSRVHEQTGNHVAILSFARSGRRVSLRATYYPLHEDPVRRTPEPVSEISLVPA